MFCTTFIKVVKQFKHIITILINKMKFIKIIFLSFLSFLSTTVAFINTQFIYKTPLSLYSQDIKLRADRFKDEAAKLRQEAGELEVSLREESRAKGVPEEMINKLIPIRAQTVQKVQKTANTLPNLKEQVTALTAKEVRSNLGYLNTGDAIRMTSELERIKEKNVISKWNSKDLEKPRFDVSNYRLKSKTSIEPLNLKLDDVGFAYQKVLVSAVAIGTVCGLGANAVGGELGFLLGYASALFPVLLVGVGSIAPGLIGEVLYRFKLLTNEESRKRHVRINAGKFLAGYVCGLPVARFSQSNPSNTAEFFQLKPTGTSEVEDKQIFAKSKFSQIDIARSSIVCLAGSVAECIEFGVASGSNPGDVNLLNELMNSVDPTISAEQRQNHIRWSALTAWEILDQYKDEYKRLVVAFEKGLPMEECIAIIEGEGEL